ncbi:hypothetical protein [Ectobacillus ponti]|uniref:Uncharacterized protein n=1 Tax=Ectobacillus ponti TaxID=2961894 RepID=A0AA41XEC3_9BACI|nr:hypothetical protein [Ectobacillus ponti]MCP8970546.1 hypothetical protein [Ectobacillus ponti]
MCEICGGTHVHFVQSGYVARWGPCPVCGPMPKEQWDREVEQLQQMIAALQQGDLAG